MPMKVPERVRVSPETAHLLGHMMANGIISVISTHLER
jgi:hypothetical protein